MKSIVECSHKQNLDLYLVDWYSTCCTGAQKASATKALDVKSKNQTILDPPALAQFYIFPYFDALTMTMSHKKPPALCASPSVSLVRVSHHTSLCRYMHSVSLYSVHPTACAVAPQCTTASVALVPVYVAGAGG